MCRKSDGKNLILLYNEMSWEGLSILVSAPFIVKVSTLTITFQVSPLITMYIACLLMLMLLRMLSEGKLKSCRLRGGTCHLFSLWFELFLSIYNRWTFSLEMCNWFANITFILSLIAKLQNFYGIMPFLASFSCEEDQWVIMIASSTVFQFH